MNQRSLLIVIVFGFLCSCGIKGRPLPPENNVVNINQLQNTTEPAVAVPTTEGVSTKETKKKSKKK